MAGQFSADVTNVTKDNGFYGVLIVDRFVPVLMPEVPHVIGGARRLRKRLIVRIIRICARCCLQGDAVNLSLAPSGHVLMTNF